ncbi:MAG: hypothetical protein ACFFD4_26385 [Candidatus Odinarchaeota archaeon]
MTDDIIGLYKQLLLQARDRLNGKRAAITEEALFREVGMNPRMFKNVPAVRQFIKDLVQEARIEECRRDLIRAHKKLVKKGVHTITEQQLLLEAGLDPPTVKGLEAVQELLFELEFKHTSKQTRAASALPRKPASRVDHQLAENGVDLTAVAGKMVVTFLTVHQRPVSLYRICRGTGLSPGTVDHVLDSLQKDGRIEKLTTRHLSTLWLMKEQQDMVGEPVVVPAIKTSVFSYHDKQVIWRLVLDTRIYSFLRNNGLTCEKVLVTRLPASVLTIHRRLVVLAERGIVDSMTVRGLKGKSLAFWYLKTANEHESRLLNGQLEQLKKLYREQE